MPPSGPPVGAETPLGMPLGPLGRLQGVHRELWGRSLDIAGVPGGFRDSPGTPPTE